MGGLQEFFQSLDSWWGYLFLFVSSMGENLFPPLPGDTFVVLGAFLVGRGQLRFLPAYVACTAGSLLGFMILYFIGARWGRGFFEGKSGRFFSQKHLGRVENWFDRYGYFIIGGNRFLSGFRGVVSLAAGIARMDPKSVFGLALLSCTLWNGILIGMGVWVGENWAVIVEHYQRVVFGLIVFVIIFFWIKIFLKRRE